jgi:hypothetical protein
MNIPTAMINANPVAKDTRPAISFGTFKPLPDELDELESSWFPIIVDGETWLRGDRDLLGEGRDEIEPDSLHDSDSLDVDDGDGDRVRVDEREAPRVVDGVGDAEDVLDCDWVKPGVTEGDGVKKAIAATELCFLMTKVSGVLPVSSTKVPVNVDPSLDTSTMNDPPTASPASPAEFAVIRTLAGWLNPPFGDSSTFPADPATTDTNPWWGTTPLGFK